MAGAGLLLISTASAFAHRAIIGALHAGSAPMSEPAIGLLTVALAIAGTLLLCRSRLSIRPTASVPPTPLLRTRRDLTVERLLATGSPEAVLLDTRHGVALILAYRALVIVAERRARPAERLSDQAGMAYRRSAARGRH